MKKELRQWENFIQYYLEINEKINLTAIKDPDEFFIKNILDSLSIEDLLDLKNQSLLDLGCGGGFPSLPLAIVYPELQITGIDAIQKKLNAIESIKNHFNIQNLETICARAELLAHDEIYREKFDIVITRAVASYRVLLELTAAFLKKDGKLFCYQGPAILDDLKENPDYHKIFGLELIKTHQIDLTGNKRIILEFIKTQNTDEKFPRKYNQIKNKKL